ncbi:MAG TPA: transglutaminase family protein, partial [Fimbriimonadaceae bacterium]|nr:transglutaminase family protein [Fimbriimonadaceae bacterium]
RSDSKTVIDAGLLGQSMKMTIDGTTWTSPQGRPLKMLFIQSSAGRTQKIVATFLAKTAEVDIDSEGHRTHESLAIPTGGAVVDDPMEAVLGKSVPGQKTTIYVLDPTTVSFLKNEVMLVGPRTVTVHNKAIDAELVQIIDPRMTFDVYVTRKGDLVKVDAPMGIEMLPESREEALSSKGVEYKPAADLAFTSSIHPNGQISDPDALTGLTLRVTGHDLSSLPSDDHQTITRDGSGWKVAVHPPQLKNEKPCAIDAAAKEKPEWLKPSLDIPSGDPAFTKLSESLVKGKPDVIQAALAIKRYVFQTMSPNAGIGVLRDASEILRTKEGVCRDYAILTVTLMRAARIPARLASGVVNWQGNFYYHAWAEVWDGSKWIGIDSTVPQEQISAAHVKLADGNVEGAFQFTFLDKVKIDVLGSKRS